MPSRSTSLTGAAGEHYVAFHLSFLGFPVGLTRGGSPNVDLLVSSSDGSKSISIQVKTSTYAKREYKKKTENDHWEWDVGEKALSLFGSSIFYAFVDLQEEENDKANPCIFVVPSIEVKNFLEPNSSRYMFWIYQKDKDKYYERWDLIKDILTSKA